MVILLWRVDVYTLFGCLQSVHICTAFFSCLKFLQFIFVSCIIAVLWWCLYVCVNVFTVDVLLHDCRRVLMFAMSCAIALTFTAFVSYSSVIVVLCWCLYFFHVLCQCSCFYCPVILVLCWCLYFLHVWCLCCCFYRRVLCHCCFVFLCWCLGFFSVSHAGSDRFNVFVWCIVQCPQSVFVDVYSIWYCMFLSVLSVRPSLPCSKMCHCCLGLMIRLFSMSSCWFIFRCLVLIFCF